MGNRTLLCVLGISFIFHSFSSFGQKTLVVLGSSTAAGVGPSSYSNSWVGKYTAYIQSLSASNTVINLAVGGFRTTDVMPTGTGGENPNHNITKALSYNPDVIIVNLPSNDAVAGMTVAATMSNFRRLREIAQNAGVGFWVTTTQPRNAGTFFQERLITTRDSIYAQFANVIDFWSTVASADGSINPSYGTGDGVHLNDAAHEIFFQRAMAKPILGNSVLPVLINGFKADYIVLGLQLEWIIETDARDIKQTVQRSTNGIRFDNVAEIPPNPTGHYAFLDGLTNNEISYYRIRTETHRVVRYSNILRIVSAGKPGIAVFPNPTTSRNIMLQFHHPSDDNILVALTNSSGNEVLKQRMSIKKGISSLSLEIKKSLPAGIYFITFFGDNLNVKKTILLQ